MKVQKAVFSLVIPVYNVAGYLRRCIESILYQKFQDWEIILVDDGSNDSSGEICDEFAKLDHRIKVFHQTNQGVSVARNKGLDEAIGDWVWFIDSDDYIVKDALQILYDIIKVNPCDTVIFGMLEEWNGMLRSKPDTDSSEILNLPKEDFLNTIFCYANPSMLFRNKVIQKRNLRFTPGIRMGEDLELQYKYLFFAEKPILIKTPLYVYSHRDNSAMTNPATHLNNLRDCLAVVANLQKFIKRENVPYLRWLNLRIRQLIKSGLQSAAYIPNVNSNALKQTLRNLLSDYTKIGYDDLADFTISLAACNPSIYFVTLRVYLWQRKLRGH